MKGKINNALSRRSYSENFPHNIISLLGTWCDLKNVCPRCSNIMQSEQNSTNHVYYMEQNSATFSVGSVGNKSRKFFLGNLNSRVAKGEFLWLV